MRTAAVAYAQQSAGQHVPPSQAAASLGISSRTLRHWKKYGAQDGSELCPRGRPPVRCSAESRNAVVRFVHQVTGPAVGLPALQALFPSLPRVILADLLYRYRRVWRRRYRQSGFELQWHHAGAVWAMDFSEAHYPVDGVYPYVFAVRDLASHRQLAWQPVADEKAETVLPILRQLLAEYGPPLVLKSDNGSAFIAETVQSAMLEAVVAQLFSPARRPQYNGALERSNSTHKVYTQQHAALDGHPFRWTSDDLAHAKQLANTISRPWGSTGPTPDEAWQQRSPITDDARRVFQEALGQARIQAAHDLGLDLTAALSVPDRARLDRMAIARTLEDLGYLTKTRVDRPPRKPKRLTRAQLLHRVDKHARNQAPDAASDAAVGRLPSNASHATSETSKLSSAGETAAAESVTPRAQRKCPRTLASAPARVIMQPVVDSNLSPATHPKQSTTRTSARWERTPLSWLRRLFTPLISILCTF